MPAFAGSPDHKQVTLEQIPLNNFEILREKKHFRFPSREREFYVAFDCPKCNLEKGEVRINSPIEQLKIGLVGDEDHVVNWPGFLLLLQVFRGSTSCNLLPIDKVKLETGWLKVAGYAARQAKPIEKLTFEDIHCESASDGATCTALLKHCQNWQVGDFRMTGDLGESFWEEMASATNTECLKGGKKSNLKRGRVTKKVLKRGRRDHLKKVCLATAAASWNLYAKVYKDKTVIKDKEEGWKMIEQMLDTV